MKIYKKYSVVLILFSVIIFGCQKEVYIDLPNPEQKLVIEGFIEQDQYAVVSVTRNSPYFSPVDSSTLAKLFVINAKVIVSDGTQTEELMLDFSNAALGVWPFICYKGSVLKGEVGKTYWLTIYAEGDTITGQTTIPEPVQLDSIWWLPDNKHNIENDTLGYIWASYNDDPSEHHYFRLFSYRRGRDKSFVPLFGSVYDDILFDGMDLTFSMYRGVPSISDVDSIQKDKELFYFKKGDTVDVKITSIDREHYEFWRTIEQEVYMGGNPFMFPVLIRHNVKGALGVWGGYSATYYTLVIGKD